MSRSRSRRATGFLAVVLAGSTLAACSINVLTTDDAGDSSAPPIVIGTSIPLSGPLQGFGSFQKWGYLHAVNEVNAAGGLLVDGHRRQVELKILDDKTDPKQAAANTDRLIRSEHVDAMLGSCTPDLVIPGAIVADKAKVPLVTGCSPILTFANAHKWTYAWDLFFFEPELAELPFETLKSYGISTNKKIAVLHDDGPDGISVGVDAWPGLARKYGYKVAANVQFPQHSTDLESVARAAKESRADVLLVDGLTPQATIIGQDIAALGYKPKVALMEKGAEPIQFARDLNTLAQGVLVGGYWDPTFGYPGARELADEYEQETGEAQSQHIADSYTAAKVLMDAMATAGTVSKPEVNAAISETDKMYPVGQIKFAPNHTAKLNVVEDQWQDGRTLVVWPKNMSSGSLLQSQRQ